MVPVLSKAPCDVRAVSRSWDDAAVQGKIICGMSRWSQVCGMSFVFRIKFVWDVSTSQGCGMTAVSHRCGMSRAYSMKFLRDVTTVSRLGDDHWCRADVACLACSA